MNLRINYHTYSHSNPSIQTLGDFVSELDSVGVGFNIPQLLIYEDEDGYSNLNRLLTHWLTDDFSDSNQALIDKIRATQPEQEANNTTQANTSNQIPIQSNSIPTQPIDQINQPYLDLPIKIGTVLCMPLSHIDRDVLSTESNQVINAVDYESFLAKRLVELLSDKGYQRTFKPISKSYLGTVKEIYPYMSVWVWSRSLSISTLNSVIGDSSSQYKNKLLNITPYIISLNTSVDDNGGSFNFVLPPITTDLFNQHNDSTNSNKSWVIKEGTEKTSYTKQNDYINQSHVHYIDNGELKRNRLYFEKVLSANDIVFIRFEKLILENGNKNLDEVEVIDINELPNQIFDMIGLIDNIGHTTTHSNIDINIPVSGRDLIKLLIEDGVYFYPTAFTESGIFANTGATNTRLKRFGSAGEYLSRFQVANKTIDRTIKYIINNLGAIEICPGSLFEGYANTVIDKDQSITQDTRSRVFQLDNETNSNTSLLAGIWQIIKIVVDDSVKDRRLTDSSIGNENGSLLNAIRKVCQDPFCEFYTDTYGSQFYFIIRKKPFDKESVLSMTESRVVFEKPNSRIIASQSDGISDTTGDTPLPISHLIQQNLIIDIEEEDIMVDSLRNCQEAYSWYKIQLNNLTSGSAANMAFAYLKAVYFNEFADVFGSKPFDISTSYIPYSPILDKNKKLPTAYFIRQGIYDLKYIIESHCYLPFTRMGNITLSHTDRRIKKGNFVRLKGTNEIAYVDSVSHSFSINENTIDTSTSLSLSRVMVEDYIKGVNIGGQLFSYFNICDLSIDESVFANPNSPYAAFSDTSLKRWKVNIPVFNFFLKKLQYAKNVREVSNLDNLFNFNASNNSGVGV